MKSRRWWPSSKRSEGQLPAPLVAKRRLGVLSIFAGSQPPLAIVAGPKLQSLGTRIVARPHTRSPRLLLGTARFTITVTNTSTVELTGVAVDDPLSPRCSRSIGTLAAEVMADAIVRAARQATGVAGFPALRDLNR